MVLWYVYIITIIKRDYQHKLSFSCVGLIICKVVNNL